MTAMKVIGLLTALEKAGYDDIRFITIKTMLVLYELGGLTRNELAAITGANNESMSSRINHYKSSGMYDKSGTGTKCNPFVYTLKSNIRDIIKKALE